MWSRFGVPGRNDPAIVPNFQATAHGIGNCDIHRAQSRLSAGRRFPGSFGDLCPTRLTTGGTCVNLTLN